MYAQMPQPLIDEEEIKIILKRLAEEITACYRDCQRELVVVGVLKGSFIFMADLARCLQLPLEIEFLGVSSYGQAAVSSGQISLTMDMSVDISDRDVLLVEDIVDTGLTLEAVRRLLERRKPRSLRVCAFLSKPDCRRVATKVDFCGKEIDNFFVVGYGLDYAQKFRHLPFVGRLDSAEKKRQEEK
jgi:hypoxanthine phosphoribosyltransferase